MEWDIKIVEIDNPHAYLIPKGYLKTFVVLPTGILSLRDITGNILFQTDILSLRDIICIMMVIHPTFYL